MTDTPQTLVNKLDDLLDKERQALMSGDLDAIGELLSAKETLIDKLAQIDAAENNILMGVQDKMQRNQILLDGALQGIRRAAARLAAVRQVRKSLETYDEAGRKRAIESEVVHKVEKRA